MTQTSTKKAQTDGVNFTVFGTRPLDAIFVPQQPFFVRADCKIGMLCDSFRLNQKWGTAGIAEVTN